MENINCKLCANNSGTLNHTNCKYKYFDILRDIVKSEIREIEEKLNEKIEECQRLKDKNTELIQQNQELMVNLKKLEDERLIVKKEPVPVDYQMLAPDTPPTQSTSLNRGMLVDTCNDESFKENLYHKNPQIEEFSSPDEKKSKFLDIPRRKKIPFNNSSPNTTVAKETKWISKKPSTKQSLGFSFIQPMHKIITDTNCDSQNKPKSSLSKISLNKSTKLKQTRINFNKATDDLNANAHRRSPSINDETYCDDIILPTPENTINTRTIRSSTSSSSSAKSKSSPESKIFDFELKPREDSNSKKPKLSFETVDRIPNSPNNSVEFVPVEDEIIFVSDSTNVNHFESDDVSSDNSCDLLENYSMEFGKNENKPVVIADVKLAKPLQTVQQNKYNEYQVTSPIRKKSEKAKRPGFDCPDCEKYYKMIGISMSDTEIQQRMNECSKHRKNPRLHHTPEGFWNPVFTPTQN